MRSAGCGHACGADRGILAPSARSASSRACRSDSISSRDRRRRHRARDGRWRCRSPTPRPPWPPARRAGRRAGAAGRGPPSTRPACGPAVASCASSASRVAAVCEPAGSWSSRWPARPGPRARRARPAGSMSSARGDATSPPRSTLVEAGADLGQADAQRAVGRRPHGAVEAGLRGAAALHVAAATARRATNGSIRASTRSPRGTAAATRPPHATAATRWRAGMPRPATRPTGRADTGQHDAERRGHGPRHGRREEPVAERAGHQPEVIGPGRPRRTPAV